jgi:hypothetical protein
VCYLATHRHTATCHACTADGHSIPTDGNTSSNRYLHPTDTDINADRYSRTANSHPYPTDANPFASDRYGVHFWL